MSLFGGFFDFIVDTVVDVVETAGSIVVDTVEFAGSVAADAIDVAVDVAEGSFNLVGDISTGLGVVANDGLDFTGELIAGLIGAIFSSNSSDQEREAAERRYQHHLKQLEEKSENTVKQYKKQQQNVYNQKLSIAQHQQAEQIRQLALHNLTQERVTVTAFIDQLKPRHRQLKLDLANCKTAEQQQCVEAEYAAVDRLFKNLKKQLKRINANTLSITQTA
ncbi:MAG: hypothetical protein IPP76_09400 [Moraxellaceae bacterium]|nr:hypothetical protein [Moraxellaceae bacterium]